MLSLQDKVRLGQAFKKLLPEPSYIVAVEEMQQDGDNLRITYNHKGNIRISTLPKESLRAI